MKRKTKNTYIDTLRNPEVARLFLYIINSCQKSQPVAQHSKDYIRKAECIQNLRRGFESFRHRVAMLPELKDSYMLSDHDIGKSYLGHFVKYEGLCDSVQKAIDSEHRIEETLERIGGVLALSPLFRESSYLRKGNKRVTKKYAKESERLYDDLEASIRKLYNTS